VQLSLHADYALRVLIYAGAHPDRIVSTKDISEAYGISRHHLVRVVQTLGARGYIKVIPGRAGGISLAMDPSLIRLGEVVRTAEPHLHLAECFDPKTNTCRIVPVCRLKPILAEALNSFVGAMDRYTLADLLAGDARQNLAGIFAILK